MTRARNVIASSGSKDNEESFRYPGMVEGWIAGAGVTFPESGADGESLSFDFGDWLRARVAKLSISWNTPSRRKVGLYSCGSFPNRRSTSCSALMTSDGWSFDDNIDAAKLATGTN